jgi:hypothetical protein
MFWLYLLIEKRFMVEILNLHLQVVFFCIQVLDFAIYFRSLSERSRS